MNMYSDDKIVFAIDKSEQDALVYDICTTLGVPEWTFYHWINKHNGIDMSRISQSLKLDVESIKLKRLVADLALGKVLCPEVLSTLKNCAESLRNLAMAGKICALNKLYLKTHGGSSLMVRILLVENDSMQRKFLGSIIDRNGYKSFSVKDANEALNVLETVKIDLAILDVMIPGMNGIELTKLLRDYDKSMPILIHTEKDDIQCKEAAFNAGADDYLVKPADYYEIILRIRALLRRSKIANKEIIVIGSTILNRETWTVETVHGKLILPKKEFELLFLLLSYPGRIFTRHQLIEEIWGVDCETEERTVDVHIKRVRERIGCESEIRISTIRGIGYSAEKCDLSDEIDANFRAKMFKI